MAIYRLQNRSRCLIPDMRPGLFAAVLSSLFFLGIGQAQTNGLNFEPRPVITIEYILPFQLERSFDFNWRRDQVTVQSGLLVVFKVDPELVTPRNELEPVLYAGNHTVQRLNHGHESGFVLGIIPEQIDLSQEPVWFGTPDLPERIDADQIAIERSSAERFGIAPLPSDDVVSLTQDPVVASDMTALLRKQAADLLLAFSPQEKWLADAWRLPVTGSKEQQ